MIRGPRRVEARLSVATALIVVAPLRVHASPRCATPEARAQTHDGLPPRPTEGGLWSYAADDEVDFHEDPSGLVRVHYAAAGPSQTLLEDADQSGVPDYVEAVAEVAVEGLGLYADQGFRPPVTEAALGLGALGGSEALDIYLVDFQGSSDGVFSTDACTSAPRHCTGWIGLENDFAGYSYPSLQYALDTVVIHELFHAVQSAYDGDQPVWFSEGTATWAQTLVIPASGDFLAKCDAYLALSDRPIDKPPTGPVQSFAYGTALFWAFLDTRHGAPVNLGLQLATQSEDGDDVDIIAGLADLLLELGDDLPSAWSEFARLNLATGPRAGAWPSHSFAAQLDGVPEEDAGPAIEDDARFSPLAANYYRLEHAGGPLAVGTDTGHPALALSVFPVADGALDGPLEQPLDSWWAETPRVVELGDVPAGGYWLVGSLSEQATASAKTRLCFGDPTFVAACLDTEEPGDEGGSETGAGDETDETDETEGDEDLDLDDDGAGCGCRSDPEPRGAGWPALLLVASLAFRRRR